VTAKTTTKSKKRVLVYVEKRKVDDPRGPQYAGLEYWGRYKGKRKLVRLARRQYEDFIGSETLKLALERKQGGRRGHGVVPGAGHCWPMKNEALAVHPRQVEAMNARNKRHGINVQYEPKWGMAIIPDEGEYKKLRRLEGVHLNNAYDD
jgi:hypothetical protein